jgi:transposase
MTRADLPKGTPTGAFGPRLEALVVLLSGTFRLSRRNVQALLVDGFGVEVSLGMISKIEQQMSVLLALPHQSALEEFQRQPVAHADETGWKEAGRRLWLWAGVSAAASVFLIRACRGAQAARELLGEDSSATCITDRWSAYEWVDIERRQLCWSHLIRDFQKIVDRGGESQVIGERLVLQAESLFHDWHLLRDSEISRRQFKRRASKVRKTVRALLEIGTASTVFGVAGLCRGILELEPAMWTFVDQPGVEPTNNAAERLIRPAVLWRKTSFGTQSPAGSRFAERILTCVATLRQQGRNVLEYLTALRKAALSGAPAPPLIG